MSKDINLKSIKILPFIKKFYSRYRRHAVFGVLIAVLLVYVLVVFNINRLANADISPEQESTVTTSIPKIDAKAIDQIQTLENNSPQVHSLFEHARNNPFQE
jgi:hypothetical protein